MVDIFHDGEKLIMTVVMTKGESLNSIVSYMMEAHIYTVHGTDIDTGTGF